MIGFRDTARHLSAVSQNNVVHDGVDDFQGVRFGAEQSTGHGTQASNRCRPCRTLRGGVAPHGVQRPRERRLLLRRHADRLGALLPRQQSLALFSPARGPGSILLLVPTRHWWAYALAAASAHFLATQQAHWPPVYALHCEAFDAVQNVATAAGIRILIKSPLKAITLRDAIDLRPRRGGARSVWDRLLGCVLYGLLRFRHPLLDRMAQPGNLECGDGRRPGAGPFCWCAPPVRQTAEVPVPRRVLEAALVGACTVALGIFVFDQTPAGPSTSPPLLYTPIPLLIWAALRFGLGGISVSMLIITFQAIWGTMRGHGPFLAQTPAENATALQLFLLVTATPLMLLAVVIEEERRSKEALRESKDQMGLAAEAANAAMWVWDVSGDDLWMTEQGRSLFGFKPDARTRFRGNPRSRAPRGSRRT